jgi:U5 small nuclear ribonucleoprotein component
VEQVYSGTSDTERYEDMVACDPEGRLMIHTTKQYPTEDTTCFHVLGRVMSGTLHAGQEVRLQNSLIHFRYCTLVSQFN